jgi:hypothetical protein
MAKQSWLTCELVDELHRAAGVGQVVDGFVDPLKNATLPALLEYGSTKRQSPTLPELPAQVISSPFGRTRQEVRSELPTTSGSSTAVGTNRNIGRRKQT